MIAQLEFLGAAETVTGSKYLLTVGDYKLLVDCGLYQGASELKALNWMPLDVPPSEIDAVVLTHGHIDHIGYLPKLVKDGFKGPIFASPGTIDIALISLPDAAHLQEEDARYANKKGFSKHKPALPLFNVADANRALTRMQPLRYETRKELAPGLAIRLLRAGHILGSCLVEVVIQGQKILFSGDLGRPNKPIIRDPAIVTSADYLLIESTYGNREHSKEDPGILLAEVINDTVKRGGILLIPSFAIARTQEVLYYLSELENEKKIPTIPVFVDSPMAVDATYLYARHTEDHDIEMQKLTGSNQSPFRAANLIYARSKADSQRLNSLKGPAIIISSSGMLTGGRIMHHIKLRASDPRNTILFVGYQAEGTRGRAMLEGAKEITIHGETISIEAKIAQIAELSCHADYVEILAWLGHFEKPPKMTYIVHGEPDAAAALQQHIQETLHWKTEIAKLEEIVEL